jgi:hypothetical protein
MKGMYSYFFNRPRNFLTGRFITVFAMAALLFAHEEEIE